MTKSYESYMVNQGFFSQPQLDQAVRDARREALEDAAKMLEREAAGYDVWTHALLERLVVAIRALKEKSLPESDDATPETDPDQGRGSK